MLKDIKVIQESTGWDWWNRGDDANLLTSTSAPGSPEMLVIYGGIVMTII